MKNPVIYLRSYRRRPVRAVPGLGLVDRQGEIPPGWCDVCGAEVYRPGCRCCERCRKNGGTERSIYGLCESL